ncbi:MAG: sulfur carrier protein ThiS [Deltaproteobacteria bacterium]|nr:sulfur carrier protein ThiS [Deltaproteobacteria bacterium]
MIITLNGETREFKTPLTVAELLKELDLDARLVVVEKNMQIVEPGDMANTQVDQGDSIEILTMVGGGS